MQDQLAYAKTLMLSSNTHKRVNCPWCGGQKTLSVSNVSGDLIWRCFRAACTVSGKSAGSRTAADLRALRQAPAEPTIPPFEPPAYWTSIMASEPAVDYLKRNHAWGAVQHRQIAVRYDPKEHRAVFLIHHDGVVVDATGRALSARNKPKWKQYGRSGLPFVTPRTPVAVVVEDCASAAAVAGCATGVAMLGTDIRPSFIAELRSYERVIIALDPDARVKALALARKLAFYLHAEVALLPDDLKYYDTVRIAEILRIPLA